VQAKKSPKARKQILKKKKPKGLSKKSKPNSTSRRFSQPAPFEKDPNVRTCEEVEIGDIGGFGSTEELEAHEERCTQPVTTSCATCSKNLCSTHYEFLHRDHDTSSQKSGQSLAR